MKHITIKMILVYIVYDIFISVFIFIVFLWKAKKDTNYIKRDNSLLERSKGGENNSKKKKDVIGVVFIKNLP